MEQTTTDWGGALLAVVVFGMMALGWLTLTGVLS